MDASACLGCTSRESAALRHQRSRDECEMLNDLSEEEQQRLLKAMDSISVCAGSNIPNCSCCARTSRARWAGSPTGMASSTARNMAGTSILRRWWPRSSHLITNYKPERSDLSIAEMNGEIVGSVFCVQASETVAKRATCC